MVLIARHGDLPSNWLSIWDTRSPCIFPLWGRCFVLRLAAEAEKNNIHKTWTHQCGTNAPALLDNMPIFSSSRFILTFRLPSLQSPLLFYVRYKEIMSPIEIASEENQELRIFLSVTSHAQM